jgi:hypothetical protein
VFGPRSSRTGGGTSSTAGGQTGRPSGAEAIGGKTADCMAAVRARIMLRRLIATRYALALASVAHCMASLAAELLYARGGVVASIQAGAAVAAASALRFSFLVVTSCFEGTGALGSRSEAPPEVDRGSGIVGLRGKRRARTEGAVRGGGSDSASQYMKHECLAHTRFPRPCVHPRCCSLCPQVGDRQVCAQCIIAPCSQLSGIVESSPLRRRVIVQVATVATNVDRRLDAADSTYRFARVCCARVLRTLRMLVGAVSASMRRWTHENVSCTATISRGMHWPCAATVPPVQRGAVDTIEENERRAQATRM